MKFSKYIARNLTRVEVISQWLSTGASPDAHTCATMTKYRCSDKKNVRTTIKNKEQSRVAVKKTTHPANGFALVVTLSLMFLLLILALGMLSLSTVSLRIMSSSSPAETARANARMAVILALGELQRSTGDDRRITADGSFFNGATQPNAVGVWKSWSPQFAKDPSASAPDYISPKTATATDLSANNPGFLRWLVSSPTPVDLTKADWVKIGTLPDPMELFAESTDGFKLAGSKIPLKKGSETIGAFAWAVTQTATKSKINVSGPEDNKRVANDDLQAQPRPSLELTGSFKQPSDDWNRRAAKVVSMSQAKLDADLWDDSSSIAGGADFTTQGYGVLADVVQGGLKTDLNLGFEMSESEFAKDNWGGVKNPFSTQSAPDTPYPYGTQRPLFTPLSDSASVKVDLTYATRTVDASISSEYPVAAVPTFNTLRSYYRTPYHLYKSGGQTTLFERPFDHVAVRQQIPQPPPGNTGPFPTPGLGPKGQLTQTSYRPVLDRVSFVLSAALKTFDDTSADFRMIVTPLVTLWNPYNVAMEIDGAVVYPWIDFPYYLRWKVTNSATGAPVATYTAHTGAVMAAQFAGAGRTTNPYFFANITDNGKPIHFEPGEVRVFAPVDVLPLDFHSMGTVAARTLRLGPSGNLSAKGGFSLPMYIESVGQSSWNRLQKGQHTSVVFETVVEGTEGYPYFVSMEDATRGLNPYARGQLSSDVQTVSFANNAGKIRIETQKFSYNDLIVEPRTFGVLETYHRVANDAVATRTSDLVSTVNPRQIYVNRYLTQGNFQAAPNYETLIRPLSSPDGLIETTPDGRSAFYGASNSSFTGRTHLAFFGAPRSPLLSLAGFSSADLTGTVFAPSYQVANSWANPYFKRDSVSIIVPDRSISTTQTKFVTKNMPVYDFPYLANEALWDSFFFSGAAPTVEPGSADSSPGVWNSTVANITRNLNTVVGDFIENPSTSPLRNPRMKLHLGNKTPSDLAAELLKPEGCVTIASHLLLDGAFNVNSTSIEAWKSLLAGMRGNSFKVEGGGSPPSGSKTAFPRFRDPVGTEDDNWNGFRSLSDAQIEKLATNIVAEVRLRGPFLSLAEFVNRRVSADDLGLKGAIQAAIDKSDFNNGAKFGAFQTVDYPLDGRNNISPNDTGAGIPGYLTQADVLQSIAPVLTVRSDTFTIRGYGEARDKNDRITATARCEMIVQRNPEFINRTDSAHTPILETTPTNQTFGRRFEIVSFRYLHPSEVGL